MWEYLKDIAENMVPNLTNVPEIDFKYMDETVAKRTNTMAYYLKSPVDEVNSAEHITLNPFYAIGSSSEPLLTTIAHEGYPGHLYARVKAKEQGLHFISSLNSCSAFAEGWAVYTQLAVLNNIIQDSDDDALNLYCEYLYGETVSGYISMLLFDIQINYMGVSVRDLVQMGYGEDTARNIIETFMEIPTVYVSYAYGAYTMINLHEQAKYELGDRYNEVEFNGILLSEGDPTLYRAQQITDEYIASKK
ncbi:MAG: DUF885 domain-containing protein [Clostridia bacterium]|nr:DUF885 domain-containing protein [Clostridia bacterium]